MYAPTPSSIQAHEYHYQEMVDHAAQVRFVADARRSSNSTTAETAEPRPAFALTCVRSFVALLTSIAFAMITKQPGVSVSRDA